MLRRITALRRVMFHTIKDVQQGISQGMLVREVGDLARRLSQKKEVDIRGRLEKDLGLDSLGRLELALEIEKHTNVEIPDRLIGGEGTLEDIVKHIYKKIGNRSVEEIKKEGP